jgi:hypothetical protein
MKFVLIMVSTLLLAGCDAASSDHNSATRSPAQSPATAAKTETARFEVKVTKSGQEFASYRQIGERTAVMYDGASVMIFLGSPDNKQHLTVTLEAAKAGAYPLAPEEAAPKQNEAKLEFISENADPPVLIASKGELNLDKLDDKYCSGSFTGAGTDIRGVMFTLEGSFSNMGVKTIAEK